MRKRRAVIISILIVFIAALGAVTYEIYMKYRMEYNPEDLDTFFDEDNVVELSQDTMDKLNECEDYNDVIKIIGKANRVAGSGFFIVGYDTFEGRQLSITLDPVEEKGKTCHKIINIYLEDKYISDTNKNDDENGNWDEKGEIFTSSKGVKLTSDEYNKLRKKLRDENIIDVMTESMVDIYLYRTDKLKVELLENYFYEIPFIDYFEIYYFNFDVSLNGSDYRVIAKTAMQDSEYEFMKKAFIENQDYKEGTVEELNNLLSEDEKSSVRDLDGFTIYIKNTKISTTNTKFENEIAGNKIKAAMFSDDTKKMYLYYYNPLMEVEFTGWQ